MITPGRRTDSGRSRQLAPELEELLKQRLMRYKRRGRRTIDGVASDLSSWPNITRWFPKAFAKSSRPTFTRRILDTWILGDTSHAERRCTRPSGARLTVIAEFLIEKGLIREFELVPDETGFGLAKALQDYCCTVMDRDSLDMSGEYEGYTHGSDAAVFHHLTIHRDASEDVFLLSYDLIESYSVGPQAPLEIKTRFVKRDPLLAKSLRKGWAVRLNRGSVLAFLRCSGDPHSKPLPWVWAFYTYAGASFLRLVSGERQISALMSQSEISSSNGLPVLTKLTLSEDSTYYALQRRDGSDLSIVRRIMAGIKKGNISKIDQDFLRAAHRCDPDRMVEALDAGADVNVADPDTGLTALLDAASRGVRGIIDILATRPDLNPTISDQHGRLASDLLVMSLAGSEHFAPYAEKLIDLEVTYEEQHPRPL